MDKPSPSGASAAEPIWLTDYRKIMEGHDAAARTTNHDRCGCDVCKLTRATIASRAAAPRQPEGPREHDEYLSARERKVAESAQPKSEPEGQAATCRMALDWMRAALKHMSTPPPPGPPAYPTRDDGELIQRFEVVVASMSDNLSDHAHPAPKSEIASHRAQPAVSRADAEPPVVGGFACRICGRDTPHGAQYHAEPAGWIGSETGFTLERLLLYYADQERRWINSPLEKDLRQAACAFGSPLSFNQVHAERTAKPSADAAPLDALRLREVALHRMLDRATVRLEILRDRAEGCDALTETERKDQKGHALSLMEIPFWIDEQRDLLMSTARAALASAEGALPRIKPTCTPDCKDGMHTVECQFQRAGGAVKTCPVCGEERHPGTCIEAAEAATQAAAAPLGAPVARLDEEMKRLQLIEKEARDLDARLTELWDLLPEGSHEDAPFSSSAVAWWGLHKALGCCTPETPTPFAFPEKPSPASDPSPDALLAEALKVCELLRDAAMVSETQFVCPEAFEPAVRLARAVLRRGGRHE